MFLALIAVAGLAVAEERPLSIAKAEFSTRENQLLVVADGHAQLPDKARLTVMLSLDGQTNSEYYTSVYVEGGRWQGELGPIELQLLPGKYVLFVDFSMGDQHPAIQKALKQGPLPPVTLRDVAFLTWGDAKEEAEARARAAEHYATRSGEVGAVFEDFLQGLSDYEGGKRFRGGSGQGWDSAAWIPWVDEHLRHLGKLLDEEQGIGGDALLGRYYPEAHQVYGSLLTAVRYTCLAHTRQFMRAAGTPIPDAYFMPERAEQQFLDPRKHETIRGMPGEVKRIVSEWSEDKPEDWAFYRTSTEEEKRLIGAFAEATLVRLRDLVKELAEKAESAHASFDPAAWEAEYDAWAPRVKETIPERPVVRVKMAAGAMAILTVKYPYVLDTLEEAARNASSYGQSTSAWLYVSDGKEAPRKYFGNLAQGAPTPKPSLDEVTTERARWHELLLARLDFLAQQLGLTPPK